MTMEDLKVRLREWARNVCGGRSGAFLGLPGHCTYLEFAIKGTGGKGPIVPERVWDTDKKIRALGLVDADLRMIVEMAYLGAGLIQDRADGAGISRRTYFNRLDEAHHAMLALYLAD